MSFKSRFYATAALVACLGFAPIAPAQAGQLFPPSNIGTNPNITCPNGQLLGWTGDAVACTNPTPGVTVSCPAGQALTGITNGQPVCAELNGGVGGGGGSSGWVDVPSNAHQAPRPFTDPQQVCVDAGYTNYTGACRGTGQVNFHAAQSTAYQGNATFEGSLATWEATTPDSTNGSYQSGDLACLVGNAPLPQNDFVYLSDSGTTLMQILCVK